MIRKKENIKKMECKRRKRKTIKKKIQIAQMITTQISPLIDKMKRKLIY